jgi:hypothetical protein
MTAPLTCKCHLPCMIPSCNKDLSATSASADTTVKYQNSIPIPSWLPKH